MCWTSELAVYCDILRTIFENGMIATNLTKAIDQDGPVALYYNPN